jgi:glutamyl-Q tRNA(Asp) synthetase
MDTVGARGVGAVWADRLAARVTAGWRTRFAPAPTGLLHLGHAVNAVVVWGLARALDGRVVLRIEDHDQGRCRAGFTDAILDDLDWLGLRADVAATDEYRRGVALRQSARVDRYAERSEVLRAAGLVYACRCSRRDGMVDTADGDRRYTGRCRDAGWPFDAGVALRMRLGGEVVRFDDVIVGPQEQTPAAQCGDVVIRDRHGNWTYQFAVSVDDSDQEIAVVVRGADLLSSVGRQVLLARALGRSVPPTYAHHPLLFRADGQKLSKSAGDTGVRELRDAGWSAEQVLGNAAHLVGLQASPRPLTADALAGLFGG